MSILRLGVIGLSSGNGHPFSWSAICNGFNLSEMKNCGFPAIPAYLSEQKFPEACIADAFVTHVWTQDRSISHQIANASLIDHVVDRFDDMIGEIDALLLARDDAENHMQFALPFLDAGIPVYIDKPIALSQAALQQLLAAQKYPGQIFTCSALKYAPELQINDIQRRSLGKLKIINAMTPKSWEKYAIHIIEPLLELIGDQGEIISKKRCERNGDVVRLLLVWSSGLQASISSMGDNVNCPISIRVMGETDYADLVFKDSFTAFKAALLDFIDGIRTNVAKTDIDRLSEIVGIVEVGLHDGR